MKNVYKYFEKGNEKVVVALFETFVACLRNRERAGAEDVELYFRKFDGLLHAMNKLEYKNISRSHS